MNWLKKIFSSETQNQTKWKVINPKIPCKRPLNLLQRIFVFTSGDANALLESRVLAGYLQDAAESTLEEIAKQAGTEFISNSTVEAEINRIGRIPESAFNAIAAIDPALGARAQNGIDRVCVRTLDDPETGQSAAIFLIYRGA